jgi:hypothetical protein
LAQEPGEDLGEQKMANINTSHLSNEKRIGKLIEFFL